MEPARWWYLLLLLLGIAFPAEGTLRVAGDRSFPPFMFLDERGEPAGLDAAVLRLLGEQLGRSVSFDLLSWADAVHALETGSADVLASMRVTPEREAQYRFVRPHNVNHLKIFTRIAVSIKTFFMLGVKRIGKRQRQLAQRVTRLIQFLRTEGEQSTQ